MKSLVSSSDQSISSTSDSNTQAWLVSDPLRFSKDDTKFGTVPAAVQVEYVKIIDTILASSDLNTISEKRIRKGLQQAVNYDITPQKVSAL